MKQHLTRRNIAFGVLAFLVVITLFQFFIVKHIGSAKQHSVIDQTNSLPDNNIQNEVILPSKEGNKVLENKSPTIVTSLTSLTTSTTSTKKEAKEEQPIIKQDDSPPIKAPKKVSSSPKKKSKLKQQATKQTEKKPTKLPSVYYLFICTLEKCERPNNWIEALQKSYNDISTKAKDIVESINFVIFGEVNLPTMFINVKISQNTIQTVSDYIANSIQDDNAMIIFITDLSVPVSTSLTDTYYMLQDSALVGGVVIGDKSGKVLNSGWDLKLRTCKGQSTHSVAFTPHLYGKELSVFLETNTEEEEMVVLIPSFNGASLVKQTWKYFGGFSIDFPKDYIFDFLLRIQEHNQVAPILPENIVKYYGSENYEEFIVSDSHLCTLEEKISFRNAEAELSKQFYENIMNLFFNRLEVKNINLLYTIPSDLSLSSQHIFNAVNMEGKVVLKLNTTQQDNQIYLSDVDRIAYNRMKNIVHSDDTIPLVRIAPYEPSVNCPRKQYCIGLVSNGIKQLKQEDVNRMNRKYDEVWVSEKRQVKMLKRMGVKKRKTQYIPNGVDTLIFKQTENVKSIVPTSYLSVFSDWEKERDQIKLLVQSFATTFDDVPNVKLTIYIQDFTSSSNDKTSSEIIKQLGIEGVFNKPPVIEILPLDSKKVDTPSFYHDYQVLVTFNENQSSLVMQAMSSGLLIISPIDLFEFLNKDNSLLIKQAKSMESWIEKLKYIHSETNISLIRELTKVARLDMVEYYDNNVIAKDILSRLRDIEDFLNGH